MHPKSFAVEYEYSGEKVATQELNSRLGMMCIYHEWKSPDQQGFNLQDLVYIFVFLYHITNRYTSVWKFIVGWWIMFGYVLEDLGEQPAKKVVWFVFLNPTVDNQFWSTACFIHMKFRVLTGPKPI